MYSYDDKQIEEMSFHSFFTKYNICLFEDEKNFNEGRFTPSYVTWFLRQVLGAAGEDDETTYEDWAKSLGIIPFKKKKEKTKKEEIKEAYNAWGFLMG